MKNPTRWKKIELKRLRPLTAGLASHRAPAWSPDGRWMCHRVEQDADATWVITDARGRLARLLPGHAASGATFSPTGAVTYCRTVAGADELWQVSGRESPRRLIASPGSSLRDPAWSPDGERLAYVRDRAGVQQLCVYETATGDSTPIAVDPERRDAHPAFSPDGSTLFFDGECAGDVAVYAFYVPTSTLTRVTEWGVVNRRPAPVSRDLLVVERLFTYPREMVGLVVIDLAGARERRLGERDLDAREPACLRTRSGRVRLAFSSPDPNCPARSDLSVAFLRGVDVVSRAPEAAEPEAATAAIATEEHAWLPQPVAAHAWEDATST